MARCLVGCGANLGSPREQLERAVELLGYMPGVTVVDVSRLRETRPVGGPPGQPSFLNGACLIETDLAPEEFLGLLQSVENALHRERRGHWGPRTIDLDLLIYEDVVLQTPTLTIPHPRMSTRRFVLEPAAEIAGTFVHPAAGCTVADLLDNISHPMPYIAIAAVPAAGGPEIASAVADRIFARVVHASQSPPVGVDADAGRLQSLLTDWLARLAEARECGISRGMVSDFWTGSLRLAADAIAPSSRKGFEDAFTAGINEAMRPQVVLLLEADRAALEERIRFRERSSSEHSNVFADCVPAGFGEDDLLNALVSLQERLRRELDGSVSTRRTHLPGDMPRAVVAIDSSDLGEAVEQAVAAVEAME